MTRSENEVKKVAIIFREVHSAKIGDEKDTVIDRQLTAETYVTDDPRIDNRFHGLFDDIAGKIAADDDFRNVQITRPD